MRADRLQFKPRQRSYMSPSINVVRPRLRFLIVCEGAKTEPQYFEKFRVPGLIIKVEGVGMNTLSLVTEALKLSQEDEYDQIWCVFDKDDFPVDHFENAIHKANENGMHVAYSNQAFELWYVLHFEFLNSHIDRSAYMQKLNQYLGYEYRKNDAMIYQRLVNRMDTAIRNAERLLRSYPQLHPGRNDPSTTVHLLVTELRAQGKPLQ